MAHKKKDYPNEWKDIIRPAQLKKANYYCEICKALNNAEYVNENGKRIFIEDEFERNRAIRENLKIRKIVLSVCHRNHIKMDCRAENLFVACQRCHLNHDRNMHILKRKFNKAIEQGNTGEAMKMSAAIFEILNESI